MLAQYKQLIRKAFKGQYAIGAFNTSDLEITQAIVEAGEGLRAPVIVNTSEKAIDYAGHKTLSQIILLIGEQAAIPVVLNLDHGRSMSLVKSSLALGYTGVMFDGSRWPFSRNVLMTKKAVQLAHRKGVPCEGELGSIAGKEDYVRGKGALTDPSLAKEFVRKTRVDLLAVAVGTAHGSLPGEHIDIPRLREIHLAIPTTPLVLHGASGTPANQIRQAIKFGVVKVNIDTDLRLAFSSALYKTLRDKTLYDPRQILTPSRIAVKKAVTKKIRLFGSSRKAS